MENKPDALAKIIVERQLLPHQEIDHWRRVAETDNLSLERVLIREKVFNRKQLLEFLENQYFCPAVDLHQQAYNPAVLSLIPRRLAERHQVFPLELQGEALLVAFADPDNDHALDVIASLVNRQIIPVIALKADLLEAVALQHQRLAEELAAAETKAPKPPTPERESGPAAPPQTKLSINLHVDRADVIGLVEQILDIALHHDATDIHLQPAEEELIVRFRIDGILHSVATLPREILAAVISRVKILAQMDIAEHRLPQDGRHTVKKGDLILDLRISCLPAQFGEKIVIRLLRKDLNHLNIANIQMPPAIRAAYQEAIDDPLGFFLVAGPTGSGKTTTLYATLNVLDHESVNILTLEDPIEYSIRGITQVQIHEEAGLTFASGLRSFLRQDPDVILVGEIRDLETVEIACRAALTGHKVFSTLHTNDACQAVTRLINMGTPPYLITATLRGVLSQRLVRVICESCRQTYTPNDSERAVLGHARVETLQRGQGCPACSGVGYRGRMALFEYFRMEESLHSLILERASPIVIRNAAKRNGMLTIGEVARRAVLDGKTTVAEIQRVVLQDEGKEQLCHHCQHVISIDFSVCPFCQQVLKETCPECGLAVDENWQACPKCGHEIMREWQKLYCRHCLAPVDPRWSSCRYCGGDLT